MKSLNFIKYILFVFFAQLLLVTYASVSAAVEPAPSPKVIGHVLWIKGSLKAQLPNSDSRILKRNSEVYEHDTLTTGPASEGRISFKNNDLLRLHENSTIRIGEYLHKDENKPEGFFKKLLRSIRNGLRAITGSVRTNDPGGITPSSSQAIN